MLLTAAATLSAILPAGASAAGSADISGTLKVISFNVDGLPIPSALSSTGRKPLKATRLMAREINEAGCDILCAQEDFNFHAALKTKLDMRYATLSSGPAVIGDGLNIFSRRPIFNVERVEWEDAYGVYDCGSDELTPKGVLCCTIEINEGVFADVYTLHADAWEDDDSMKAKEKQFAQLSRLIEERSGTDRAVILTGDFNVNYSIFKAGFENGSYKTDLYSSIKTNFLDKGFRDAWIEANNDGDYDFTPAEMYERYGREYPRTWDTLDHIFYRDGAGLSLELISCGYEDFDCGDIDWDGHLSDHAAVKAEFSYKADTNEIKAPESFKTEKIRPLTYIAKSAMRFFETLIKALKALPELVNNGIGWIK